MRHSFRPWAVRKIAIGSTRYVTEVAKGPDVVIETPSGWSVRRRLFSRTVRIEPPAAAPAHQSVTNSTAAGGINQMMNVNVIGNFPIVDGHIDFADGPAAPKAEVIIYLPAGCKPGMISL